MGNFELAQVNISRMKAPLDDPSFRDFVGALEPVNAIADHAPGFVWRLQTEDGDATSIRAFEWDVRGTSGILVNMSVWTSVEALADWVDPPADAPKGVPRFVVPATHGGLVADPPVQKLIRGILRGDPSDLGPRTPSLWARVVGATARPWLVPSLPTRLGSSAACIGRL